MVEWDQYSTGPELVIRQGQYRDRASIMEPNLEPELTLLIWSHFGEKSLFHEKTVRYTNLILLVPFSQVWPVSAPCHEVIKG